MGSKINLNALLCTALVLAVLSVCASAIPSVERLTISPDPANINQVFTLKAKLGGMDESICSLEAAFYLDDYRVQTMNVKCGADSVESHWTQNEWDRYNLNCGVHTARVELRQMGTLQDNYTQTVNIGIVPDVSFSPQNPTTDREFTISFKDPKTKVLLTSLKVKITDPMTGNYADRDTSNTGMVTYTTKNPGLYRITVSRKEYCGQIDFYVKKPLIVDGPHPSNPVIDEPITIGVPQNAALGIKILNSAGNLYKTVFESISGGANFTISDAGNYTIVIGELSSNYWPVNKSLTVYARPTPEVSIFPDQPSVGKSITISVSSRGVGLDGAIITVTRPDGVSKEMTAGTGGKINYDASSIGTYTVRIEKDRYDTVETTFDVYYGFSVQVDPTTPTVNDTITLTVKNQDGAGVGDASVSIPATGFLGYTNSDGKISFKLNSPGDYDLMIGKSRYWNTTEKINVCGILALDFSSYEIELGQSIEINSSTCFGDSIESTIAVTEPNGLTNSNTAASYTLTPQVPGDYFIAATKRNFQGANATLKVNPHPLDVSSFIQSGSLIANVTSHGSGVEGIKVSASMDQWSGEATTNNEGLASFSIPGAGQVKLSVNSAGNRDYIMPSTTNDVVKSYNFMLLLIPLVVIVFTAAFIVIVLQLSKRREGGSGRGRGGGGSMFSSIKGSSFVRSTSQRLSKL